MPPLLRRDFLAAAAALAVAPLAAQARRADAPAKPKLKKAVKYDMVAGNASPADKFALLKKVGFKGCEINHPNKPELDLDALVKAKDTTGVEIHGVICSTHWNKPLSAADPKVREGTFAAMQGALKAAKVVGADTVLLVPGVARNGVSYQECWDRSTEEVKKLIPTAAETGVRIAIEVVWNDFLTKPEQLVQYVDQFDSKWVGAYFDCSNMLKYGVPAAAWIRALGKRMLKFDFKGYSAALAKKPGAKPADGFAAKIGEGDEDWPEVLKACAEVGYNTWATAEVGGGYEKWLREVSTRMDKILELP